MSQNSITDTNDIVMYTADDIKDIFHFSRSQAYSLIHANGFPSIRINNRYVVPKDALEKWINSYIGREFRI